MYRKTRITKICSMKVNILFNVSIATDETGGLREEKERGNIKFVMETSMNALPSVGGYLLVPACSGDREYFERFGWAEGSPEFSHFQVLAIHSKLVSPGLFIPVVEIDYFVVNFGVWTEFIWRMRTMALPGTLHVGCYFAYLLGLTEEHEKKLLQVDTTEGDPIIHAIESTIYDEAA